MPFWLISPRPQNDRDAARRVAPACRVRTAALLRHCMSKHIVDFFCEREDITIALRKAELLLRLLVLEDEVTLLTERSSNSHVDATEVLVRVESCVVVPVPVMIDQ